VKSNNIYKPTIAIIGGTGKEGHGLALRWASVGYPIIIGSRQIDKAKAIANELNTVLNAKNIYGMLNNDAADCADISVLTIIHSAHEEILENLRNHLEGKILIDTTARVDYQNPEPPCPPSAARISQNILGSRVNVVAAFQNIPAYSLRKNLRQKIYSDVLVCADVCSAADTVIDLACAGGMNAYYAGNLDNAIVAEGITSILISINKHYKIKTATIAIKGFINTNQN
jgi:NADPH-dependent F420 reductase